MKKSKFIDSQIIEWRGKPNAIRCDSGVENVSGKLITWAEQNNIRIEYIQLGKPQQNAYIERFNRTVRYEWLSQYCWENPEEVRLFATNWVFDYNHEHPNMDLGGFAPMQRLAMAA